MRDLEHCTTCLQALPAVPMTGGTGYGIDNEGNKHCYLCCSVRELVRMHETGKATLYLSKDERGVYVVTDWPGTLRFNALNVRDGRHNIAGTRTDVEFYVPSEGRWWYGTQYGKWTQIIHCKRRKS